MRWRFLAVGLFSIAVHTLDGTASAQWQSRAAARKPRLNKIAPRMTIMTHREEEGVSLAISFTGDRLIVIRHSTDQPSDIVISRDGKTVVAALCDGSTRIWDISTIGNRELLAMRHDRTSSCQWRGGYASWARRG